MLICFIKNYRLINSDIPDLSNFIPSCSLHQKFVLKSLFQHGKFKKLVHSVSTGAG